MDFTHTTNAGELTCITDWPCVNRTNVLENTPASRSLYCGLGGDLPTDCLVADVYGGFFLSGAG